VSSGGVGFFARVADVRPRRYIKKPKTKTNKKKKRKTVFTNEYFALDNTAWSHYETGERLPADRDRFWRGAHVPFFCSSPRSLLRALSTAARPIRDTPSARQRHRRRRVLGGSRPRRRRYSFFRKVPYVLGRHTTEKIIITTRCARDEYIYSDVSWDFSTIIV